MLGNNLIYIKKIITLNELGSTNDYALSLEKAEGPSGTIIRALKQSQGRGRLKRRWFMQEGDIAMSMLLREPHVPHNNLSLMPWLLALASVEALREFSLDARLKWPNDIVLESNSKKKYNYCGNYEKIGGVLVENIIRNQKVSASVLGLGLNIVPNLALKKDIPHIASLQEHVPRLQAQELWPVLLRKIDNIIAKILAPGGGEYIRECYLKNCISLNRKVRVLVGEKYINGITLRLDDHGFLVVFDGQKEHVIYAGEVNFLD
jgi:BirA family biotin operon repressor/biotin-[acetyl-CoA-carboxylase] ligase